RVPRPTPVVCGIAPVRFRMAEPEGSARHPCGAHDEPGGHRTRIRTRADSRRVRWHAGTDSRRQSYSHLRVDHGSHADPEPRWCDDGTAIEYGPAALTEHVCHP